MKNFLGKNLTIKKVFLTLCLIVLPFVGGVLIVIESSFDCAKDKFPDLYIVTLIIYLFCLCMYLCYFRKCTQLIIEGIDCKIATIPFQNRNLTEMIDKDLSELCDKINELSGSQNQLSRKKDINYMINYIIQNLQLFKDESINSFMSKDQISIISLFVAILSLMDSVVEAINIETSLLFLFIVLLVLNNVIIILLRELFNNLAMKKNINKSYIEAINLRLIYMDFLKEYYQRNS